MTQLLVEWRGGRRSALQRERPGHVLQATALVNEAFIRLLNWREVTFQNRAHFLAMAARLMRNVLIDIARRRAKDRQERDVRIVDIDEAERSPSHRSRDLVAIDDALRDLAARDPRKAQIVEMRFFGGLNLEEIAEVLGVAPVTISREWAKARAWPHRQLDAGERNDQAQ